MHRSAEQWEEYARQQHKYIIFYEGRVMDVTNFIHSHPGGKKALINYIYKDVTYILFKVFRHDRERTLATLAKYIIGTVTSRDRSKTLSPLPRSPLPNKEKKKVCFQDRCEEKEKCSRAKRADQKSKTAFESSPHRSDKSKSQHKLNQQKAKEEKKNKRFEVSIKLLENSEDRVIEDRYNDWGSSQTKKTAQISKETIQEDLDEQKPIFRVPVMMTKLMTRFQN